MEEQINIADIVTVDISPAKTPASYAKQLWASIINAPINVTFDELFIEKKEARQIYKRAYPRAKV